MANGAYMSAARYVLDVRLSSVLGRMCLNDPGRNNETDHTVRNVPVKAQQIMFSCNSQKQSNTQTFITSISCSETDT